MTTLATPEGTARYAKAHPAAEGATREAHGLTLSTLGFGSYLGAPSAEADAPYVEAFVAGLRGGVNVLDTASVYRGRRSERVVGRALRESGAPREGVLVATKGGFVPHDAESGLDARAYVQQEYVRTGVLAPGDVVDGHAMTPRFLAHELAQSLASLGLDAVDVYFVHNPEAQLMGGVPREAFEERLRACFAWLEEQRREGRVGAYGLATWLAFRVPPEDPRHVPLERALRLAEEVGGRDHGLRALELPYNLAMPEAAVAPTQEWRGRRVPLLTAAREAGLLVLGSATLMQGRLLAQMPAAAQAALGARSPLEAAIQLSRSTPGITSALVGTGRPEHARANLAVRDSPAAAPEAVDAALGRG